jgi:hypothetical protein
MKMLLFPATLAATLAVAPFLMGAAPMLAGGDQRRSDQMSALQARKTGAPSLREIEYLGSDYDSGSAIYTLKFLRDGTVIWVDVDGRNGQIVGRTGR